MNSKYQAYYNALNGKDFGSYVSTYTSTLNSVSTMLTSMDSIMASSWVEKGLEYIKSTIMPALKTQQSGIEQGVSALSSAASKCNSLIAKLGELKSACDAYLSCNDEEKETYQSRITSLEGEVDNLVSEINSISLEITDASKTFGSYVKELNDLSSLQAKKAEFIGNVNDKSKYYIDPAYSSKAKELLCFDNTTGEILKEGDTIYMKPGETRILTVRLPYNAGEIKKVIRTTADGDGTFRSGNIVTARSDINPDSNVVDYVNYKPWSRHVPSGVDLHTNYYDWIVTAKADGTVQISQTCEYTNTSGGTPKAMVDLNVVVKS